MYATHQPMIAEFAKQGPNETAHVVKFVLVSIRRRFDFVTRKMYDVGRGDFHGLSANTKTGLTYIDRHTPELYRLPSSDVDAIRSFLEVPGLGIPKAGFVTQLLYGISGCLDTHNLREYGLDSSAFRADGTSTATLTSRIHTYLTTCKSIGGSEFLWDQWCRIIATTYPKVWGSAEAVSHEHVTAILNTFER